MKHILLRERRYKNKSGHQMIQIQPAVTTKEIECARILMLEYANSLGVDLAFQGFEEEMRTLPGAYTKPAGQLLLAQERHDLEKSNSQISDNNEIKQEIYNIAGCVAVRPIDHNICEMKRLYVRPEFRGLGLGRQLAQRAIAEAKDIGYQTMRLDTLPMMQDAQRLYWQLGFHEISVYRFNPIAGTRFFELKL